MKTLIFFACATAVVAGCSRNHRDLNPFTNVQEAAKDKDLQNKSFLSECSNMDAAVKFLLSGFTVKAQQTMFRFEGSNATRETRYYAATGCTGDALFVMREKGVIKIDKNQKTNDGGYNIDIHWTNLAVAIASEAGARAANTGPGLCGKENWKASDKNVDVTAQAKKTTCYDGEVPRWDYNIYRVDSGTLYLGRSDKTGNNPKSRPAKLESTKYPSS